MCAEFTLKTSLKQLEKTFAAFARLEDVGDEWDLHLRLYGEAPVLVNDEGHALLKKMQFSLKPPGTPYPTFNARLSNFDEKTKRLIKIHERPTWRKPLAAQRCLIPLTGFIEPIYLGDHAGSALQFSAPDAPLLFAAGIYDTAMDPKTGELYEGFALILHTPNDYILKMGHHRMPVFLKPDDAKTWLSGEIKTADEAYQFLLKKRFIPKLTSQESRHLAKNWQRKQSEYETKLKKEKAFMAHLNQLTK